MLRPAWPRKSYVSFTRPLNISSGLYQSYINNKYFAPGLSLKSPSSSLHDRSVARRDSLTLINSRSFSSASIPHSSLFLTPGEKTSHQSKTERKTIASASHINNTNDNNSSGRNENNHLTVSSHDNEEDSSLFLGSEPSTKLAASHLSPPPAVQELVSRQLQDIETALQNGATIEKSALAIILNRHCYLYPRLSLEVFEFSKKYNLNNAEVYIRTIKSVAFGGLLQDARILFDQMRAKIAAFSFWKFARVDIYNDMIFCYGKYRFPNQAIEMFNLIKHDGYTPDAMSYARLIGALQLARAGDAALRVFHHAVERRIMSDVIVRAMLRTLITMGWSDKRKEIEQALARMNYRYGMDSTAGHKAHAQGTESDAHAQALLEGVLRGMAHEQDAAGHDEAARKAKQESRIIDLLLAQTDERSLVGLFKKLSSSSSTLSLKNVSSQSSSSPTATASLSPSPSTSSSSSPSTPSSLSSSSSPSSSSTRGTASASRALSRTDAILLAVGGIDITHRIRSAFLYALLKINTPSEPTALSPSEQSPPLTVTVLNFTQDLTQLLQSPSSLSYIGHLTRLLFEQRNPLIAYHLVMAVIQSGGSTQAYGDIISYTITRLAHIQREFLAYRLTGLDGRLFKDGGQKPAKRGPSASGDLAHIPDRIVKYIQAIKVLPQTLFDLTSDLVTLKRPDLATNIYDLCRVLCVGGADEWMPPVSISSRVLVALVRHGEVEEAWDVLAWLEARADPAKGSHLSVEFYEPFIERNLEGGQVVQAISILERMKGRGLHGNVRTYTKVVRAMSSVGMLDQALGILKIMRERGPPPDLATYSIIITALGDARRIEQALQILSYMEKDGIQPDVVLYSQLIKIFVQDRQLPLAFATFRHLEASGISIDMWAIRTLVYAYFVDGQYQKVIDMWCQHDKSTQTPSIFFVGFVVLSYLKLGFPHEAKAVLDLDREGRVAEGIYLSVKHALRRAASAEEDDAAADASLDAAVQGLAETCAAESDGYPAAENDNTPNNQSK